MKMQVLETIRHLHELNTAEGEKVVEMDQMGRNLVS